MIVLIQRVIQGKVLVQNNVFSKIGRGYVVLLGIFQEDTEQDVSKLAEKLSTLRIMADKEGKMNLSITDAKGEVLVVSQFTLCADLSQGRRPSFIKAKNPEEAEKLYELFVSKLKEKGISVKTGKFGQYMEVQILNDGPVTIIADSKTL
ncbi:D-tyrosyl-tRNA(Tyr) deacylase [Candidatus Roizmanbacteria bacterium]|nr:D-tyrosyl-tRNA(Tyr) deacylase [Candidatus Roizmanbacteria bacterium]